VLQKKTAKSLQMSADHSKISIRTRKDPDAPFNRIKFEKMWPSTHWNIRLEPKGGEIGRDQQNGGEGIESLLLHSVKKRRKKGHTFSSKLSLKPGEIGGHSRGRDRNIPREKKKKKKNKEGGTLFLGDANKGTKKKGGGRLPVHPSTREK